MHINFSIPWFTSILEVAKGHFNLQYDCVVDVINNCEMSLSSYGIVINYNSQKVEIPWSAIPYKDL